MDPAWWIPGAHLQTAWARIARSRQLVRFEREVLTTPDDDDLVLDHVAGPPARPACCCCTASRGAPTRFTRQGLAVQAARVGWRCTVLNFRSCARDARDIEQRLPNRRPASITRATPPTSTLWCAPWRRASRACRCTRSDSRWAATCCSSGWARRGTRAPSARRRRSPSPTTSRPRRATSNGPSGASTPALRPAPQAEGAGRAGAVPTRDRPPRSRSRTARAHVPRVRRMPDRAAARLRGRGRLLPARELPPFPVAHRRPHPLPQQRGRSVLPGRRRLPRARRRLAGGPIRDHALGRPHRLRHRDWPWRPRYWAEERASTGWRPTQPPCGVPHPYPLPAARGEGKRLR